MKELDFGNCPYCGGKLHPVWFTDEETQVIHGSLIKTGRKRRAISHLVCEDCFRNQIIDDSYDGNWYGGN